MIVKNLGTRTTRTCIAHSPKVIGCVRSTFIIVDTNNMIGCYSDIFVPNVIGFIICGIYGNIQFFCWKPKPLRGSQIFPTEFNCILLKIITKAKISHHFKKSMMARSIADVFQVIVFASRTDTTLCCSRSGIGAFFQTEKHVFKLVHSGISKK